MFQHTRVEFLQGVVSYRESQNSNYSNDDSITEHPLSTLAEEESADKLDDASKSIDATGDERLQKILNVFTTRTLDLELRRSQQLAEVLNKLNKADEERRSLKEDIASLKNDNLVIKAGMENMIQMLREYYNQSVLKNKRRKITTTTSMCLLLPPLLLAPNSPQELGSLVVDEQDEDISAEHGTSRESSQDTSMTKLKLKYAKRKKAKTAPKVAPLCLGENVRTIMELMKEHQIVKESPTWTKSEGERKYLSRRKLLYQYIEDKGEMFDDDNTTLSVVEKYRLFKGHKIRGLGDLFVSWSDMKDVVVRRGLSKNLFSEVTKQRIDEELTQFVNSPDFHQPGKTDKVKKTRKRKTTQMEGTTLQFVNWTGP